MKRSLSRTLVGAEVSGRASAYLDFFRAVAAMAVMTCHIQEVFFVTSEEADLHSPFVRFFYFITDLGKPAIIVFFVLSGFLIAGSTFRMIGAGRWSWTEYLIQRLARLWTVLVPALVLTFVWDKLSTAAIHGGPAGNATARDAISALRSQSLDLPTFMGNLCFLQDIFTPHYGSNSPLWTLAYEFWFYVAFPLVLSILWARTVAHRITAAICLACLAVTVRFDNVVSFGIWLFGVLVIFLPGNWARKSRVKPAWVLYALAQFGVVLCWTYWPPRYQLLFGPAQRHFPTFPIWTGGWGYLREFVLAAAFCCCVFMVLRMENTTVPRAWRESLGRACEFFAGFSYSLYLLHGPLLVWLKCNMVAHGFQNLPPAAGYLWLFPFMGAICLLYSWAIAALTEQKTPWVRAQFRHRIHQCQSLFVRNG